MTNDEAGTGSETTGRPTNQHTRRRRVRSPIVALAMPNEVVQIMHSRGPRAK